MPRWEVNGQLFLYDWENAVDDPRTASGKRSLFVEQPRIHAVVVADNGIPMAPLPKVNPRPISL